MCGIIGYVGKNNCLKTIISGLEHLEYRGYDSAGIAFNTNNKINIIKQQGKIENLKSKLNFKINSNLGIGHTRWATNGKPNVINSHPHKVGKITIVHNGIIENCDELKKNLLDNGYSFKTDTDTEVACAMLDYLYKETNSMQQSMALFKDKVIGSYALGIICDDYLDTLYAVKKDSPLIIALGKEENYIASDVPAILDYTNKYIILNDGEFAIITSNKIIVYDENIDIIKKDIKTFEGNSNIINKNGYEHYMLKEIEEEAEVIKETALSYLNDGINSLNETIPDLSKYKKIDIIACGSAMHAGLIGKVLIEECANIPVNVEYASEYRYKKNFYDKNSLVIAISQSGETADTLAAINIAKKNKIKTLGIINVVGSSIARAVDSVLYTKAGPEIAVATTKAYSAQVLLLGLIALATGIRKNIINDDDANKIVDEIRKLPTYIQSVFIERKTYYNVAKKIYKHNDVFFIGRSIDYALSMEGALKLKEVSYINAQSYAAGELKHGTISLIEKGTPIFAILTDENIISKTMNSIKECKARGANITVLKTENFNIEEEMYDQRIEIPKVNRIIEPILAVIPLQLVAYETAKLRKCDIDKPKNLAKSVTVE